MVGFRKITSLNRAIITTLVAIVIVVITAFYWNEARKEVVFLCGNFTGGVSQSSVLKQLQTGNYLRYQVKKGATGSRISVDSVLGFGAPRCLIDFDREDKVIQAVLE
ncbi:MAG: hypothetical protein HKP21_04015 [Xanthomonadales bacterium]|nr:hypothetical protein [Gammaproteobacteria bacterium]NNK03697.1 hypothetical protein [Xanthomonadales bacterium]